MIKCCFLAQVADPNAATVTRYLEHQAPWHWTVTLAIVLAVFVFFLTLHYWSDTRPRPRRRWISHAVHATAVTIVLGMCYRGAVVSDETRPPRILFVFDNSGSMSVDSSLGEEANSLSRIQQVKNVLFENDGKLLQQLASKYQVVASTLEQQQECTDPQELKEFIESIQPTYPQSPLGDRLSEIIHAHRKHPAAIIFVTDGISNAGKNLASVDSRGIPVFTVRPFSDVHPKDIDVTASNNPTDYFRDDTVRINFNLAVTNLQGQTVQTVLRRMDTGSIVDSKETVVTSELFEEPVFLTDQPSESGSITYSLEATRLEDELTTENNQFLHAVTVHDTVLRVLLIQSAPSFEFRFLQSILSRQQGSGISPIERRVILQSADLDISKIDPMTSPIFTPQTEDLAQFDLIIYGDVDPHSIPTRILDSIADFVRVDGKSIVFLLGERHAPQLFQETPLAPLFPFDVRQTSEPPRPISPNIRLTPFGMAARFMHVHSNEKENANAWKRIAPTWRLIPVELADGIRPLAEFSDQAPAITYHFFGRGRVVCHFFDALYTLGQFENEDQLERYWLQLIRFLSQQRIDTRDPELRVAPPSPRIGDQISLIANLPANRMAPTESTVPVRIEGPHSFSKRFVLNRNGLTNTFSEEIGRLPIGSYRVSITNGDLTSLTFEFSVTKRNVEMLDVEPRLDDLARLAEPTGGQPFVDRDFSKLIEALPLGTQERIATKARKPFWNSPWIGVVLIGLIVSDWLIHRST